MIRCQLRLAVLLIAFMIGGFTINEWFFGASGIVVIVSISLGYKKEGW